MAQNFPILQSQGAHSRLRAAPEMANIDTPFIWDWTEVNRGSITRKDLEQVLISDWVCFFPSHGKSNELV
ncbi:hypothetical protein JTE90_025326 [Oedothorax gibbosus]|uniref:Uncharacterized protein n=1 Tax=Oedothorax gibbosus TaxID=931172 RepID=A0AAV6V781_9ARAC|nr:hypothetical protein JTE90_025326 [Oedothorax gibbosus]